MIHNYTFFMTGKEYSEGYDRIFQKGTKMAKAPKRKAGRVVRPALTVYKKKGMRKPKKQKIPTYLG